jgi:Tol biopolymer transport system component
VFVVNQNARPNSELVASDEPSSFQARVKDLLTGKEVSIADSTHLRLHPQISHDGTLLAYTAGTGRRIQILPIDQGPPRMIVGTEDGGTVWDWSADNKGLLLLSQSFAHGRYTRPNIYVHDVSAARDSLFLSKPGYELYQAKFSPDDRAVALVACGSRSVGEGCRLFVVPKKIDGTSERDNWIAIDHPSFWDDKPRWSPDGNLIYFISDRDGQFCLWAQGLESRTKEPTGTPSPLYHFHDSRLAMNNVGTSSLEIDVARNKIVMGLGELTGKIWSLKR